MVSVLSSFAVFESVLTSGSTGSTISVGRALSLRVGRDRLCTGQLGARCRFNAAADYIRHCCFRPVSFPSVPPASALVPHCSDALLCLLKARLVDMLRLEASRRVEMAEVEKRRGVVIEV